MSMQIYQPIHPSIRPQLDPEYARFHDDFLQYIKPYEADPWDPATRFKPSPASQGVQKVSPVGSLVDHEVGDFQARVFTPAGAAPENGWPTLVWYHGGGFVMGGLESENGFLTHVCRYVKCVVASINYRHAPEFKHPTAFTDGYNGLQWVIDNASKLSVDPRKIAIGGLSAGGCIAATTTLKAVSGGIRPVLQLLVCPVLNNTATAETAWAETKHSPWLTPSRMTWYRSLYFSNSDEAKTWEASPVFAPEETIAMCPTTVVAIAECDLLRPEALEYSKRLLAAGVDVHSKVYPGGTHMMLLLAGIHKLSQEMVHDACSAMAKAFGHEYSSQESPILKAD